MVFGVGDISNLVSSQTMLGQLELKTLLWNDNNNDKGNKQHDKPPPSTTT